MTFRRHGDYANAKSWKPSGFAVSFYSFVVWDPTLHAEDSSHQDANGESGQAYAFSKGHKVEPSVVLSSKARASRNVLAQLLLSFLHQSDLR